MPLSNRLTQRNRLNHPSQFKSFFSQPVVLRLPTSTVFYIPNNLEYFRMGITFKAKGSSIERNRVKRCVREVFREKGEYLKGFDFNILIPNRFKINYAYVKRLRAHLLEELEKWEKK